MLTGTLIAESLRENAVLDDVGLRIVQLSRVAASSASGGQPPVWTLIEFTASESDPDELAAAVAGVLAAPGWYADFHTDDEVFVVFPGRVIRYRRGDHAGRDEATVYARAAGVPEAQLDWSE